MIRHVRFSQFRTSNALITLVWLCSAPPLRAQPGDGPAADAPQPADAAVTTMRSRADDFTVRELLETNPTTPAELVRVADLLIDLGAMVEAAPLTERLAQTQLDEATLAALAEQFGSATFLKFALVEELRPDGRKFADAVFSAAGSVVDRF